MSSGRSSIWRWLQAGNVTVSQPMRAMKSDLIARAGIIVNAGRSDVWTALVTQSALKQYMFGADVISDWKEGSRVVWKGEWEGRAYEDKGVVLQAKPERLLQYTHFSPLAGLPDVPENYHTVTIELSESDDGTHVTLTQDGNDTEKTREHSEKNWSMMLEGLKKYVEGTGSRSA